jgi:hypothetical protein
MLASCHSATSGTNQNVLSLGDPFIENAGVSGTLTYTITKSKIVHNISEIESIRDDFIEDSYISVGDTTYIFPDFINTNGYLQEGVWLVVVDVIVNNTDADNSNTYGNPYIFRADGIITLVDISETVSNSQYVYKDICCFDKLKTYEEHPFAYEVKPGDTATLKLGYLISARKGDESREKANLYAFASSGNPKSTMINLGLGDDG